MRRWRVQGKCDAGALARVQIQIRPRSWIQLVDRRHLWNIGHGNGFLIAHIDELNFRRGMFTVIVSGSIIVMGPDGELLMVNK